MIADDKTGEDEAVYDSYEDEDIVEDTTTPDQAGTVKLLVVRDIPWI